MSNYTPGFHHSIHVIVIPLVGLISDVSQRKLIQLHLSNPSIMESYVHPGLASQNMTAYIQCDFHDKYHFEFFYPPEL